MHDVPAVVSEHISCAEASSIQASIAVHVILLLACVWPIAPPAAGVVLKHALLPHLDTAFIYACRGAYICIVYAAIVHAAVPLLCFAFGAVLQSASD